MLIGQHDPSKCLEDKGNGLAPDDDCNDCSAMEGRPPKQACADGYKMSSELHQIYNTMCTKITCTAPGNHSKHILYKPFSY